MRLSFFPSLLLAASLLLCCGFSTQAAPPSGQPADERKAQDELPQSNDAMWTTLARCKVHQDPKTYTYRIDYTPQVKAMKGKRETIAGFMLPLETTETFTHFLLSKRTPTCPFCPPGEPNEVVEVFLKKPIKWDESMVVITGTMDFTDNPELGLFFQLKDGVSVETKPYSPKETLPPA